MTVCVRAYAVSAFPSDSPIRFSAFTTVTPPTGPGICRHEIDLAGRDAARRAAILDHQRGLNCHTPEA